VKTNEIVDELDKLRREVFTLIGRVRRLEDRIELAIEAPTIEKRIVPPSVVGAAAQLGEQLTEGRRITRESKESAQSLRRAIASDESRAKDDESER
jgi:hypothetical protein